MVVSGFLISGGSDALGVLGLRPDLGFLFGVSAVWWCFMGAVSMFRFCEIFMYEYQLFHFF